MITYPDEIDENKTWNNQNPAQTDTNEAGVLLELEFENCGFYQLEESVELERKKGICNMIFVGFEEIDTKL